MHWVNNLPGAVGRDDTVDGHGHRGRNGYHNTVYSTGRAGWSAGSAEWLLAATKTDTLPQRDTSEGPIGVTGFRDRVS